MLVIMVAQNSPKLTIVRPRGSTLVAQADTQASLPADLPLAPKNNPSDTAAVEQQAMGKPSGRSEGRRFGFTKDLLDRLPCPTNGQRAYYFDTKGSRGFRHRRHDHRAEELHSLSQGQRSARAHPDRPLP